MKKLTIVLAILLMVVMVSGCTEEISTKKFSISGMSFLYPDTWNITTQDSSNSTLIMVKDGEFMSSQGAKGSIALIMKVVNASDNITNTPNEFAKQAQLSKDFTNTTINIAGTEASDMSYTGNDTQGNISYARLISFNKDKTLYLLMFATGGGSDIEASKPYFDVIVKSFEIS